MNKKLTVFFLLLSACQSPVQENRQLTAFRACRSYEPGTRTFDNCMKEQGERESIRIRHEQRETMVLQGGRDAVRDKEAEIDCGRASWRNGVTIPDLSNNQ